ncbi:TadE family type IV pilus minor pilin [Propionicimonas paludicola]|uniref:TadE family type IV pilus minor pilin n=1 Tax=Propionicimonas paludicola TaxID=185243 RepID=UPI0014732AF8|nr:TadE family type IV pilus minor pilin [Propionicimonas paludicola]
MTAEFAFASLAMVGAVVLIAWLLTALMLLAQCQGLAAEVARQEARGDRRAAADAIADRPPGAVVHVGTARDRVRVEVSLDARPWASWLPAVPLRAEAVVLREPS